MSAAAVSLDNPVRLGQKLWRLSPIRRGQGTLMIQEGTVTELNWHYFKVTPQAAAWCHPCWHRPEWLDARSLCSGWQRDWAAAVRHRASICPPGSAGEMAFNLLLLPRRGGALRPIQWAGEFLSPPHPRSIAAGFRWLAAHGLAVRTGGRRGRWNITLTPTHESI